jgi:hypothetical protein
MNKQDQQAIDDLFRHLYQASQQSGSRDADAEALIQRYVQQAPPGLLYQMAQTLVAQQHAIKQLRAQAGGGSAGFAPSGYGQPGYGQPGYAQPGYGQPGYQQGGWQQAGRGGGFLAGAGQIALGVGGGILGAEVLTSIFDGGLFDGDRGEQQYDEGYQQGFAAGDDYGDRNDYAGQDPGGYDQDPGGYDDGGFNDGGFDNGGGFL